MKKDHADRKPFLDNIEFDGYGGETGIWGALAMIAFLLLMGWFVVDYYIPNKPLIPYQSLVCDESSEKGEVCKELNQ